MGGEWYIQRIWFCLIACRIVRTWNPVHALALLQLVRSAGVVAKYCCVLASRFPLLVFVDDGVGAKHRVGAMAGLMVWELN
jgi:hypothetical protein